MFSFVIDKIEKNATWKINYLNKTISNQISNKIVLEEKKTT